jgi:hypothetical protein
MSQMEKTIIEELRQYSSPAPDPDYEDRVRELFLKRARQQQHKKKIARNVKWIGSATALIFIMIIAYKMILRNHWIMDHLAIDTYETQNHATNTSSRYGNKLAIPSSLQSPDWEYLDPTLLLESQYFPEQRGDKRFYTDVKMKKLYLFRGKKGAQIYETDEMTLSTPHVYPLPANQNQYLVWFEEHGKSTKTNHLIVVKENGSFVHVEGIPQQGYGDYLIEWSPSGKKALIKVENDQHKEWEIGEINPYSHTYRPLYGKIEQQATKANKAIPTRELIPVTWSSDNTILLYNKGAYAFYEVNTDNRFAWELPILPPDYKDFNVIDLIPLQNREKQVLVETGQPKQKSGLDKAKKLFLLDITMEELTQLPTGDQDESASLYELSYLGMNEKNQILLSDIVAPKDLSTFTLVIRAWDPDRKKTVWEFDKTFDEAIFITQVKLSPDQKKLAFTVQGTSTDLYVINTENGVPYQLNSSSGDLQIRGKNTDEIVWLENYLLQFGNQKFKVR